MKFKVTPLRYRGRRLPMRAARNGASCVGELLTHQVEVAGERFTVTTLQGSDPMSPTQLPELYDAVLVGFAPLAFRLRGFERVGGSDRGYGVVQEWLVEAP